MTNLVKETWCSIWALSFWFKSSRLAGPSAFIAFITSSKYYQSLLKLCYWILAIILKFWLYYNRVITIAGQFWRQRYWHAENHWKSKKSEIIRNSKLWTRRLHRIHRDLCSNFGKSDSILIFYFFLSLIVKQCPFVLLIVKILKMLVH